MTDAHRTAAEQATHLRQVLDGVDVPEIGSERANSASTPQNRGNQPEQGPRPYRTTETTDVTLRDLDRLGDVLSAAVDEAGVEIDEVAFTFRTEARRALQCEAIADGRRCGAEEGNRGGRGREPDCRRRPVDCDRRAGANSTDVRRPTTAGDTSESEGVESGPIDVSARVEIEYWLSDF